MKDADQTNGGGLLRGRRVVVAGAGPGGLVAALALARRGAAVEVLEKAAEIAAVGAGIQISPNGARVLEALGLGPALDAAAVRAQAVLPMDAVTGRALTRFDLTGLSGPPYRFIHRAALIDILADACAAAGVAIRTGRAVDAAALPEADLLVGADGLHSVVRPLLNGADAPFFTGQVAWRAVIPAPQDWPAADPVARVWMAPGRHMVTYPLPDDRLNIVAVQERRAWAAEGWAHADDPAHLRQVFAGLCWQITALLARVEQVALWGLHRHPVAARWHDAGLALLGDAAHPTLPFLAQGANLAFEDGWVLAEQCDRAPLDEALPRYQALRRDRVARAIAGANANARRYHLAGVPRQVAHLGLRAMGAMAPGAFVGRMGWLYDHDVTAG